MHYLKKERGFTLIELLVVIGIVAILAGIVIAYLSSARQKGNIAAGQQFSTSTFHALGAGALLLWDFDESGTTVIDSSGNGNTGVEYYRNVVPRSTDTPSGKGGSVFFEASPNQSVIYGPATSATLDPLVDNFTLGAWIKPTILGGYGGIMTKGWISSLISWELMLNQSGVFTFYNGITEYSSGVSIKPNIWTYVTASYSGGKLTMYVNGQQVSQRTGIVINPTTYNFAVGATASGSHQFFGYIDEVHVYGQALTSAQVERLYADSAKRFLAKAQ